MVNCRQAENPYTTHDLKLKIQLTVLSEELDCLSVVGSFVVGVLERLWNGVFTAASIS